MFMTLGVTQIYPYTLVTLCQPNIPFNFILFTVAQSLFISYSLNTKLSDKIIADTAVCAFCYLKKQLFTLMRQINEYSFSLF